MSTRHPSPLPSSFPGNQSQGGYLIPQSYPHLVSNLLDVVDAGENALPPFVEDAKLLGELPLRDGGASVLDGARAMHLAADDSRVRIWRSALALPAFCVWGEPAAAND